MMSFIRTVPVVGLIFSIVWIFGVSLFCLFFSLSLGVLVLLVGFIQIISLFISYGNLLEIEVELNCVLAASYFLFILVLVLGNLGTL